MKLSELDMWLIICGIIIAIPAFILTKMSGITAFSIMLIIIGVILAIIGIVIERIKEYKKEKEIIEKIP